MEKLVIALLIVTAVSLIWAQWLRARQHRTKCQAGGRTTAAPAAVFTGTSVGGREGAEKLARDMATIVNACAIGQLSVSQTVGEFTGTPMWAAATRGEGPSGPVGATYTERSTTMSGELTERVSTLASAGKRDEAV